MSYRTSERALISLSVADVAVIEKALASMGSSDAARCLSSLRADLEGGHVLTQHEVAEVWADGSSVQVRAIAVCGDPVDLAAFEARDFARRILAAADTADAG